MPELPEIETVKLQLEKVLVGQTCIKYQVSSIKGNFDAILNKKVTSIVRKGKVLLIYFGEKLGLGFHFKMTGQLVYIPSAKGQVLSARLVGGHPTEDFWHQMPSSHTRAVFHFSDGTLYFNDQRMFGWIMLNPKFVDKLGPEPFEISDDDFVKRISKTKRPIKLAIMDQELISGVGNIYANDALWEAKIDPREPSNKVTSDKAKLLLKKIKLVLTEGIKYGGATAADAKYLDLRGMGGHYQEHFRVYDQEGKMCKRCKSVIEKFVLGGRGTYYCPKCQV